MIKVTESFKEKVRETIALLEKENSLEIELVGLPGFILYSPYYALEKKGHFFLTIIHDNKKYEVTML